ncbi:bifunctional pyr operon transcriptional regulator/uracil phosphoribosyltransferase PyrR [Propionivibrio limicola]|uniref:bifunctional pyr operon transcriptional regulator/uracil phosphoribosyltransferase PyrR n=1 Tax=Propionivibrio limicola TaxID=167645 RepID=UPI0012918A92|nr:phosphoribosyltransferase domain-containing protein [Propionivibrio limicola]
MDRPPGKRTCLYNTPQLDFVIDEMACQAAGLLTGRQQVAVIGVLRRGAPLADRLTGIMAQRFGIAAPLRLDLAVKRYADDLTLLYPETRLTEEARHATLDLNGYTVLVVDDVLYSGHSLLKVVEYLARKQPAEIRVVTLVDRGVTRLPVRTDVVGVRLDIAPCDIIECNVPPYEPEFKIELLQPDRGQGDAP